MQPSEIEWVLDASAARFDYPVEAEVTVHDMTASGGA